MGGAIPSPMADPRSRAGARVRWLKSVFAAQADVIRPYGGAEWIRQEWRERKVRAARVVEDADPYDFRLP